MPFRDDLVQRTIQQIAQILAHLLGHRSEVSLERLLAELDEVYVDQLGLRRDMAQRLDRESLLELLSSAGELDRDRAFLAAELLRAEAVARAARNEPVAPETRLKALDLTLAAAQDGLDTEELPTRVIEHLDALEDTELPEATLWRLFHYRVRRGGFAGAEDLLFEALDRFGVDAPVVERGRAFYADLRGRSDAALRQGGLPRAEVEEGAAEFERRAGVGSGA